MRFDYYKLANEVQKKRKRMAFSLRKLESLTGISHAELSRIENGMRPNVGIINLIKLCEILNLDFVKLLKDTNYLVEKKSSEFKNVSDERCVYILEIILHELDNLNYDTKHFSNADNNLVHENSDIEIVIYL